MPKKIPEPTFAPAAVTTDTWRPRRSGAASGPRERSAYQKQLDAMVKEAYASKQPVALELNADAETLGAMEKLIRKAGDFLGLGIRFGEEQASKNKGKVIMTFRVTEKRKHTPKPKTP